jgi:hypothetical protein
LNVQVRLSWDAEKFEVSSDGGSSGSKKCCGGTYDGVWWNLRFAGVWSQAVGFMLVHLAGIWNQ